MKTAEEKRIEAEAERIFPFKAAMRKEVIIIKRKAFNEGCKFMQNEAIEFLEYCAKLAIYKSKSNPDIWISQRSNNQDGSMGGYTTDQLYQKFCEERGKEI